MFDSVSEYRLWDNAKKRFYKEKGRFRLQPENAEKCPYLRPFS